MSKKFLLVAGALLALAACDQLGLQKKAEAPAAPPAAVLPTEAEGEALLDRLAVAVGEGDAVKIVAFFAPDAVVVSSGNNTVLKTGEANLADTAEFVKLGAKPVLNERSVQVLDADTIVTTGVVTLDFKKNGRPTWIAMRITDVWQKQADGAWLVVNEHGSNMPRPLAARLAPLVGAATAEQADAPPLGGSTPAPAPAPEKK